VPMKIFVHICASH